MSSDVTYLESFVEDVSTVPNEIKRNLELLRDMDEKCSLLLVQLRESEYGALRIAEETVLTTPIVPCDIDLPLVFRPHHCRGDDDGDGGGGGECSEIVETTMEPTATTSVLPVRWYTVRSSKEKDDGKELVPGEDEKKRSKKAVMGGEDMEGEGRMSRRRAEDGDNDGKDNDGDEEMAEGKEKKEEEKKEEEKGAMETKNRPEGGGDDDGDDDDDDAGRVKNDETQDEYYAKEEEEEKDEKWTEVGLKEKKWNGDETRGGGNKDHVDDEGGDGRGGGGGGSGGDDGNGAETATASVQRFSKRMKRRRTEQQQQKQMQATTKTLSSPSNSSDEEMEADGEKEGERDTSPLPMPLLSSDKKRARRDSGGDGDDNDDGGQCRPRLSELSTTALSSSADDYAKEREGGGKGGTPLPLPGWISDLVRTGNMRVVYPPDAARATASSSMFISDNYADDGGGGVDDTKGGGGETEKKTHAEDFVLSKNDVDSYVPLTEQLRCRIWNRLDDDGHGHGHGHDAVAGNNDREQNESGKGKNKAKGKRRNRRRNKGNIPRMVRIARLRRDVRILSEEKVRIAEQMYALIDETVRRLDRDLEKFEEVLKGSGAFEATTGGAKPNDLAAIQVTPNTQDWILAKVISQVAETGIYKLADEDVESNKIYNLPESQVVVLGGVDRLSRGDAIYAVYPDTTSFYQATVAQPPRKVSGGESFVMVNFKDDADENGITHDKAVLMKHVMRVPYGALA